MGKRLIAILAAALIALVGAVLVFLYARGADQRAIDRQSPVAVYVASAAVPAGTTLKDAERRGLIAKTAVAKAAKPAGALESITAENANLLALTDVAPGTYLLEAGFGQTPVGTKAIQVPAGMLAVSVALSDPARVGTFVTPGSHLTIFATYKLKKIDTSEASKQFNELDIKGTSVLLGDVLVIGMGNTSLTPAQSQANGEQPADQAQGAPSFLVTVAVSPQDAARLTHAINQYTLYAGLRGDEVVVDGNANVDDRTIFGAVQ